MDRVADRVGRVVGGTEGVSGVGFGSCHLNWLRVTDRVRVRNVRGDLLASEGSLRVLGLNRL